MREELGGNEKLLAKATPAFPPYGKRMLRDSNWFKTLTRDNVELVTGPIARSCLPASLTSMGRTPGRRDHNGYRIQGPDAALSNAHRRYERQHSRSLGRGRSARLSGHYRSGLSQLFIMYGPIQWRPWR